MRARRGVAAEQGQAIILLALSLPLLFALLLLVVDGGRLFVERERLRNAAQLAAEAGVARVAESPGLELSRGGEETVRRVVAEALRRNLGVTPRFTVTMPFRTDIPNFNLKVRVEQPFEASIQRVRFTIAGEGAAQLGQLPSPSPPPPSWCSVPAQLRATAPGASTARVVASIPVDRPWRLAADTQRHRVYVANRPEPESGRVTVSVIDGSAGRVTGSVQIGNQAESVAANPRTGRVYVAEVASNDIAVLDGPSLRLVATITTPQFLGSQFSGRNPPVAVAVDPTRDRLYAASLWSTFLVFDAATNRVVGSTELNTYLRTIAVDPGGNRTYVVYLYSIYRSGVPGVGAVNVAAASRPREVSSVVLFGGYPWAVAFDAQRSRLFVTNGDEVAVVDVATARPRLTGTVSARAHDSVAVSARTGRVYVVSTGAGVVSVIDGAATPPRVVGVVPVRTATDVAIDDAAGCVYVTSWPDRVVVIAE